VRKWLVLLSLIFSGCALLPKQAALKRYEFERPEMGVPFRIVLYAASGSQATNAAEAAFARVAHLNELMSDYESESELSRLGRTSGCGQKVRISDELWTVLKKADEISRASDGAFDVTVGPLVQLWRRARRQKELPAPDLLEKARARVGYKNLVLKNHTAELKLPEMRLDLGGIAKGYAADEALRILKQNGIRSALCAASGDIAVSDAPPGQKGWKIQIAKTANRPETPFLVLKNCGVSTSGDAFQFVEIAGKRYSHIVDPHTGLGLTDRSTVTVIARNDLTADGIDDAVNVLGPGRGLQLARRFGVEGREIRISESGVQLESATAGFWKHVEWIK
jgi:thiamine biosynthesis lipoprotein